MAVLSTKPVFVLRRDWWEEPQSLKNWNSTYMKPSITPVEPSILMSKGLYFAMQWSSKGQSANSFPRLIGLKPESFRSICLPVEYSGCQKVPNKDFSMWYEPHINEPKQSGQNFGEKFRIFISVFYTTHWAPFWISSKLNATSHWQLWLNQCLP